MRGRIWLALVVALAAAAAVLFALNRSRQPEAPAGFVRADAGPAPPVLKAQCPDAGGRDGARVAIVLADPTASDGEICSPDGWCWEWPRPLGSGLNVVWGQGAELWAGGGTVIRRHDGAWTYAGADGLGNVVAISGNAGGDVWALADDGAMAHWVNGALKETAFDVRDAAKTAGDTEQGNIRFGGIWVSPTGQVWAVGGIKDDALMGKNDESGDRSHIAFLGHFDGERWQFLRDDDAYPLGCVWGASDAKVWACSGPPGGACRFWNGRKLSRVKNAPTNVCEASQGDAAEVAKWYREGGHLQARSGLAAAHTAFGVNGFFAAGTDDVWAVGDGGVISHWNGSAWSRPAYDPLATGRAEWHDLWASDDGKEAWAVGSLGTREAALHLTEGQWTSVELSDALRATARRRGAGGARSNMPEGRAAVKVAVVSPNDVWAYSLEQTPDAAISAKGAVLAHWDGSSWHAPFTVAEEQEALGPWREIATMVRSPDGTVWMTSRYNVGRITPTGKLEKMAEVPPEDRYGHWYLGLAAPKDDEVWVAGMHGIFVWDGHEWHREQTPGAVRLEAIYATPTDLWAAGPTAIFHKRRSPKR